MARKTADALEILRRMSGDDPGVRARVAQAVTESEIARMVYDARNAAGLTQRTLAKLVGTDATTIDDLEEADYEGNALVMLQRIGETLGLRLVPKEAA